MNYGPLNELLNNKAIFLRKQGDVYQSLGQKFFQTEERVRFRKKSFVVPKHASRINKWGKATYYMDFDRGSQVLFSTDKRSRASFTADEMDMFLERGMIDGFVRTFKSVMPKDWTLTAFTLIAGIGIGFMLYHYVSGAM